uniref:sugar ABC transporter permease n=1 Tax=Klebsiella pneumoniae TaxID=573 RepID=UPI0013D784A2
MKRRGLAAWGALLPLALIVLVGYVGTVLWTLRTSVSSSRTFPKDDFVGLQEFERLLDNERWQLAIHNLAVYGVLYIAAAMVIG